MSETASGSAGGDPRRLGRREALAWVGLVAGLFGAGYYAAAAVASAPPARDLTTPPDRWIPFHPAWILAYVAVYPASLLPLFVVRDADLFRRIARAYLAAIGLALACFLALPVSGQPLRDAIPPLDPGRFLEWGILWLHRLDPPTNLLPSLHLALATLAVVGCGRASPVVGRVGAAMLGVVALSVVGTRQHYAIDGLAGLALALGLAQVFLRPWRADPDHAAAHPPQRALRLGGLYLGLLVVAAALFAAGCRADREPSRAMEPSSPTPTIVTTTEPYWPGVQPR